MAKYPVEHTCGHRETHSLVGPNRRRQWQLERLSGEPCSACAAQATEQARSEASARAAAEAQTEGLPPLAGTERQIAWAETLRVARLREAREALQARLPPPEQILLPERADAVQSLVEALDWLERQDQADWWIEHRELRPIELLLQAPCCLPHLAVIAGPAYAERRQAEDAARQAAAAERAEEEARQLRLSELKAETARRAAELFGRPVRIRVWLRDGDKRVYAGADELEYYHTGGRHTVAGTLKAPRPIARYAAEQGLTETEAEARFREFCQWCCKSWNQVDIRE